MKDHPSQSGVPGRLSKSGRILAEALLVAAVGAVFAFAANRISPRGLALTRDYFPTGVAHQVRPAADLAPQPPGTNSAPPTPADYLAAQMKEKGLQLIAGPRVVQLFQDPGRQQDAIVFIDARKEEEYQKGHIPGAYEFDPYHPEDYLAAVLPVGQNAGQIVVYCSGGDCDDSETAALLLRDVGIANQKLFVYGGGFTEWTNNRLPVETGARNRGVLLNTNAAPGSNNLSKTNR